MAIKTFTMIYGPYKKGEDLFETKKVRYSKDDGKAILDLLKKNWGKSRVTGLDRTSVKGGYKCSAKCRPNSARGHNIRDKDWIKGRENIDENGVSKTLLDMGTLEETYEKVFGEAVREYNAFQTRKDRKINNYLTKLLEDGRRGTMKKKSNVDNSRKPIYEFIFQVGKRDNRVDTELSIEILEKFATQWMPEHYPNLMATGIYLHADEYTIDPVTKERLDGAVHVHFDYIPVAHALTKEEREEELKWRKELEHKERDECEARGVPFDIKKFNKKDWEMMRAAKFGKALKDGMSIQSSLSGACCEMGFRTKGKLTAQIQMEESVRQDLLDFAESYGLKVNREIEKSREETVHIDTYKAREDAKKILNTNQELQKQNELKLSEIEMRERKIRNKEAEYSDIESKLADLHLLESEQFKKSIEFENRELLLSRTEHKIEEAKKIERECRIKETELKRREQELEDRLQRISEIEERYSVILSGWRETIEGGLPALRGKTANEIRSIADEMDRSGIRSVDEYVESIPHDSQIKKVTSKRSDIER